MRISDRDQAIFNQLTRELASELGLKGGSRREAGSSRLQFATVIAGLAALPASIATGIWWVGLAGFPVAVLASLHLIERLPRPSRRWLRDHALLPTRAHVDRRSYDGTIVTRRTYILPPRLIVLALASVVAPLILLTALTRPDTAPPPSPVPSQSELMGSRPGWG